MGRRQQEAGLTLIELMTALLISAVVSFQVLAMMATTKDDYYEQKQVLQSQIDARLIADMTMRDARAAGFMVPSMAGISSIDGGVGNPDSLCTSDPAAISENTVLEAPENLQGAPLTVALGSGSTVAVADSEKDIDGDGDDDFAVGSGLIVSDGTRTHCARIEVLGAGTIQFTPAMRSGSSRKGSLSSTRAEPEGTAWPR